MDRRMQRFVLMLLLLVPAVAAASSDGGHAADPAEQWRVFSFSVVNFLIFAYLMRRFAGPPLKDFLSRRRTDVAEAIEAANAAKLDADRVKAEYEAKAANLDEAKAELIAEVKAIAETEHSRVIAAAREGADRMRRDAELTAESDLARARRELRAEAARLAAGLAAEMIRAKLDDAERERLLRDFIVRVHAS